MNPRTRRPTRLAACTDRVPQADDVFDARLALANRRAYEWLATLGIDIAQEMWVGPPPEPGTLVTHRFDADLKGIVAGVPAISALRPRHDYWGRLITPGVVIHFHTPHTVHLGAAYPMFLNTHTEQELAHA